LFFTICIVKFNNIIVSSSSGGGIVVGDTAHPSVAYCDVYGNTGSKQFLLIYHP
jgi:hypothetical protein